MKVLAVLQARVSSSRLPEKVLKPIMGKPMLVQQVERVSRSELIDKLVVATSNQASDDPIEQLCEEHGLAVYRGSLDDVLDRYYQAVKNYQPLHVVRLTGDCPVADPGVIDQVIAQHLGQQNDYTANILEPTYPDGLDVEVMTFAALEKAWQNADLPSEREHVTPYIRNRSDSFRLANVGNDQDISHHRWTVDEPEDFELIVRIYKELLPKNRDFRMSDILDLIASKPELGNINNDFERNAGMNKSFEADKEYVATKEQADG